MSLILETGEGIPDSNSYLNVTEAETILTDLGYETFPSESVLINPSLYIDGYLDPSSFILTEDQGLMWPRQAFTDNQGRTVKGIPKALKRAVAIIAVEFMEEDLFDVEPSVISESYGNSSVEFAYPQSKPGKVVSQLAYLRSLGYGGSNTTSVRLIRA